MAISETHYRLLRELRERDLLPQGGRILEIGQANWYGDMDPREVLIDFCRGKPIVADTRYGALEHAIARGDSFAVVDILYSLLMDPIAVVAIDADPSAPRAQHLDLNTHIHFGEPTYNVSINHGTAEHIFNIANVFRVMHDATVEGGLMIHEAPFTGWVDHGFWNIQPATFWDVAAANGYEMVKVAIEHLASKSIIHVESREHILELRRRDQLPDNAMLWVAMRKGKCEAFKVPMQGVYAGTISESAGQAWRELR